MNAPLISAAVLLVFNICTIFNKQFKVFSQIYQNHCDKYIIVQSYIKVNRKSVKMWVFFSTLYVSL